MKILKNVPSPEWISLKYLDREISIEVVQRSDLIEYLKYNDKFTVSICDEGSPLNFLLDVEGLFSMVVDEKTQKRGDFGSCLRLTTRSDIGLQTFDFRSALAEKKKDYVNLFNLKVFGILMCLGNPEVKAHFLFEIILGEYYQREFEKLVNSRVYDTEDEAINNLMLSWTDHNLEHVVRQIYYFSELFPKKYFEAIMDIAKKRHGPFEIAAPVIDPEEQKDLWSPEYL